MKDHSKDRGFSDTEATTVIKIGKGTMKGTKTYLELRSAGLMVTMLVLLEYTIKIEPMNAIIF